MENSDVMHDFSPCQFYVYQDIHSAWDTVEVPEAEFPPEPQDAAAKQGSGIGA